MEQPNLSLSEFDNIIYKNYGINIF